MKNLIEHLKEEINCRGLVFEKFGVFDGAEDITNIIVNTIKDLHRDMKSRHISNFDINFVSDDFAGIEDNIFFDKLNLNVTYNYNIVSSGEYISKEANMNGNRLAEVNIDITYSDYDWRGLYSCIMHELTHAFEDYNRRRKETVKTISDIEDGVYTNAVNNINSWNDSLEYIRNFVSFYAYMSCRSELNAFIAEFSGELNSTDIDFDLSKDDIIKKAFQVISDKPSYKKYKELEYCINTLQDRPSEYKKLVVREYNNLYSSNKTFEQIYKEMKRDIIYITDRLNSRIPKIICDYIEKHTIAKRIK